MKKKDWGWVIEILPTHDFYPCGARSRKFYSCERYAGTFKTALVCDSRDFARFLSSGAFHKHETVRKVSLTKTGKPKKIIGRG